MDLVKYINEKYGEKVDLGLAVVGRNLNLVTVRGFSSLEDLAVISGPDIYDQMENRTGTQRDINLRHSREAVIYALESIEADPSRDARSFPEIILNARDLECIELYDAEAPGQTLDLSTVIEAGSSSNRVVGVRVLLSKLNLPVGTRNPQISRVDGNHRLYAVDMLFEEDEAPEAFPKVPFSLNLNLSTIQEMKLFSDINGEHVGMQPAIIDNFDWQLADEEKRKQTSMRPLLISMGLIEEGMPFQDMVGMGGAVSGYRDKFGVNAPIKLNSLKSAIKNCLAKSNSLVTVMKDEPDKQVRIIANYYHALKQEYPEAWTDKKNFILMQSIGLNGFAMFGGYLIDKAMHDGDSSKEFFIPYIRAVKSSVPIEKSHWEGIAGGGGASVVFDRLVNAATDENANAQKALQQLSDPKPGISDLPDTAGEE